jgi:hypothetical protein
MCAVQTCYTHLEVNSLHLSTKLYLLEEGPRYLLNRVGEVSTDG